MATISTTIQDHLDHFVLSKPNGITHLTNDLGHYNIHILGSMVLQNTPGKVFIPNIMQGIYAKTLCALRGVLPDYISNTIYSCNKIEGTLRNAYKLLCKGHDCNYFDKCIFDNQEYYLGKGVILNKDLKVVVCVGMEIQTKLSEDGITYIDTDFGYNIICKIDKDLVKEDSKLSKFIFKIFIPYWDTFLIDNRLSNFIRFRTSRDIVSDVSLKESSISICKIDEIFIPNKYEGNQILSPEMYQARVEELLIKNLPTIKNKFIIY